MRLNNPKISVIGAGSWGTTLASIMSSKEYDVILWVYEKQLAQIIKEKRINSYYLPKVALPSKLNITTSITEAIEDRDIILIVVPSQVVRQVIEKHVQFIKKSAIVISASKGIENKTGKRITQVIKELLPKDSMSVGVLSGPTFANEVAIGLPAAAVLAFENSSLGKNIQKVISTPNFRIYLNDDPIGVEFGGAVKNIIAIAAGISDGLKFGCNTRAALITRGLVEMIRLAISFGAKEETLNGLSGLGDLVLTCTGNLSRNRSVGIKIGEGISLDNILSNMNMVVEGIPATRIIHNLSRDKGIEMPITQQVHSVLFENKSPKRAVSELLSRSLKEE